LQEISEKETWTGCGKFYKIIPKGSKTSGRGKLPLLPHLLIPYQDRAG